MQNNIKRRRLPHLYFSEGMYFITYRIANTIPNKELVKLYRKPEDLDEDQYRLFLKHYQKVIQRSDYGVKYLKRKEIAEVCKTTLHYPDGKDYKLICYCIMPTHIHLVFELLKGNKGISKIMQSIKGISARRCNEILNRRGTFWQDESYDRWIRNDREFYFIVRYVLLNPVEAGLAEKWDDWNYTYCHSDYCVI